MDTFEVLRCHLESHFIGLVCTVLESDVGWHVNGSNRTCHGLICVSERVPRSAKACVMYPDSTR